MVAFFCRGHDFGNGISLELSRGGGFLMY